MQGAYRTPKKRHLNIDPSFEKAAVDVSPAAAAAAQLALHLTYRDIAVLFGGSQTS